MPKVLSGLNTTPQAQTPPATGRFYLLIRLPSHPLTSCAMS